MTFFLSALFLFINYPFHVADLCSDLSIFRIIFLILCFKDTKYTILSSFTVSWIWYCSSKLHKRRNTNLSEMSNKKLQK